jgi:hypothetical protein
MSRQFPVVLVDSGPYRSIVDQRRMKREYETLEKKLQVFQTMGRG